MTTKPAFEEGEIVGVSSSSTNGDDLAAILSFVFAIVGLCATFCSGLFGMIFPIISVILYVPGKNSEQYSGLATAGAVISTLTLVLTIMCMGIFLCFYGTVFLGSLAG